MSKTTPPAPDYTGAAQQQAAASKDITNMQTWANRPNMNTPFGSSTWDAGSKVDPATGQRVTNWTNNVTLDPNSQAALDAQTNIGKNRSLFAGNLLGNVQQDYAPDQQLDYSKLPSAGVAPEAGGLTSGQLQTGIDTTGLQGIDSSQKYQKDAGDAIYGQFSDRAEPRFARQQDDLRSRLYAQGLRDTDQAFINQTRDMNDTQNDARKQASYQATIGSGAEAQRMQGMDASNRSQMFGERNTQGNFANTAAGNQFAQDAQANAQNYGQNYQNANYANALRNQAIQEHSTQQNQNLNAMNALLTGQQVQNPQFQNFSQATKSETPNLLGATQMQGQNALDSFNAQQGGMNALISGASGLGSAYLMSDRRLKRNIRRIGTWRGHKVYEYDYLWGEHTIGVMSDEVPSHAVIKHSSGFDMVNYGSL